MRRAILLAFLAACSAGLPVAAQETTSPKGYIEMPVSEDGSWVLVSPPGSGRSWGTPTFIRYLVMVAQEWKRRHPDGPRLRYGDLSKPDGSNFPPHKTHKDGLTADVFTTPRNVCHVNYQDQNLTLELAQLMYDLGAKQILYNGELVVKTIGVAKKWPKHDDHFHVVIDPSRVPAEGALMVMPQGAAKDGGWVSRASLGADLTGLEVAWRVLGTTRTKGFRVEFDDLDDADGVLHTSDLIKSKTNTYKVPVPLLEGNRYRWRVELVPREGEPTGCGWQTLQVDLKAPSVTALSPSADAEQAGPPTLTWRYEKPGVSQGSYWIDLDRDPSHRKVWVRLGPFRGAASSHLLEKKLKRNKRYHWRVRVVDAHGNEAPSEWQTFKTTGTYGKKGATPPPQGSTGSSAQEGVVQASALNMRDAPNGKVLTSLSKGTRVRVLGEQAGWLQVQAEGPDGKPLTGFVSKRYIKLGG